MKHIGIIDIGSNSVRLLLVKITSQNSFRVVTELKEYVRLGEGFDPHGNLMEEKINDTVKVLSIYKDFCNRFEDTKIIATATEAVRKAKNQSHFIEKVTLETGINIEVLSGEKEAYYDYFASINTLTIKNGLIMDIGGASTELILVEDRNLKECVSLPFGAITLTKKFGLENPITNEVEKQLKGFLQESFSNVPWLKNVKTETLIGIGGSIRNIAKIAKKQNAYPLDLIHNYVVNSKQISDIYNNVSSKSTEQRKKIKGLSKDRADIFLGALCAVDTLIAMCKIKTLTISRNGLREGVLLSTLFNENKIDDIVDFSLNNILTNHNLNTSHNTQIYKLTKALFMTLKPLHRLDNYLLNVIKTSSMLHDVGNSISYYYGYKHSAYIILNSLIYGLTPRECVMSALAVSYYKNDNLPSSLEKYKNLIDKLDIYSIKVIGVLLRLAINLNKDLSDTIDGINCVIEDDVVIIKTISNKPSQFLLTQGQTVSDAFKELLGKRLYIV